MVLQAEVQRQQVEIKRLRQIIVEARGACTSIAGDASKVMSTHQPRSKWAFAKGALQTAQAIANRLAC